MNKNKNNNTPDYIERENNLSLVFGHNEVGDNKKSKYLNTLKSRDDNFAKEARGHNLAFEKRQKAINIEMKKDILSQDSINNSLEKGLKVEGVMDVISIAETAATGGPILSMLLTEGLKNKILGLVVDDRKKNIEQQNNIPEEMPAFQRDHELSMELTPTYKY